MIMEEVNNKKASKSRPRSLRLFADSVASFMLSLTAGILAGVVTYGIRQAIVHLDAPIVNISTTVKDINIFSMMAGLSLLLMLSVVVIVPIIWRRLRSISLQRLLLYTAIQVFGIALGLIGLSNIFSVTFTIIMVTISTRFWWYWEGRWRGVGRSPSLISGLIRPALHPGQIWFAFVKGEKETKSRPVMILASGENNKWIVAYCTSREPKYEAQKKYLLSVPVGTIRGIEKASWINLSDVRPLKRNQFRTYIGLAPRFLYEEVCGKASVEMDSQSWTIPEESAGSAYGPLESEIRRSLGFDYNRESGFSVENWLSVLKGVRRKLIKK